MNFNTNINSEFHGEKELSECRENERLLIADTLRDGLGQILVALNLHLDALLENNIDSENLEAVEEAKAVAKLASDEYKKLNDELRKPLTINFPLKNLIDTLIIDNFEEPSINVTFTANQDNFNCTNAVKSEIMRMCKVFIDNGIKHSNAKNITLSIEEFNKELIGLTYKDNGIGFDSDISNFGVNLREIHKTVPALGGSIHVNTHKGEGTIITAFIPPSTTNKKPQLF